MDREISDIAEETFVAHWPKWLRWVVFIPSAFIISILASMLYLLFVSLSGFMFGFSASGFWWQLTSSAILGSVFIYVGSLVAPSHQFMVSIFLMVLLTIVSTILFLTSFLPYVSIGPVEYGIHTVVILISGGVVVFNLKHNQS